MTALPATEPYLCGTPVGPEAICNAFREAADRIETGLEIRQFTLNLFDRMNRELGSCLDLKHIEHQAVYEPSRQRMEIFAGFNRAQDIRIEQLGETFHVEAGERIMTEISRKFRLETLIPYLEKYGLKTLKVMTDERDWFAVLLLQRAGDGKA